MKDDWVEFLTPYGTQIVVNLYKNELVNICKGPSTINFVKNLFYKKFLGNNHVKNILKKNKIYGLEISHCDYSPLLDEYYKGKWMIYYKPYNMIVGHFYLTVDCLSTTFVNAIETLIKYRHNLNIRKISGARKFISSRGAKLPLVGFSKG